MKPMSGKSTGRAQSRPGSSVTWRLSGQVRLDYCVSAISSGVCRSSRTCNRNREQLDWPYVLGKGASACWGVLPGYVGS